MVMEWDQEDRKADFSNHVTTLIDLGPVRIVDFVVVGAAKGAIRYLFDEPRFTLHTRRRGGTAYRESPGWRRPGTR